MQDCTIKEFVDKGYNISFRNRLHGDLAVQVKQEEILGKFSGMNLSRQDGMVTWGLTNKKVFSTKYVYYYLEKDTYGPNNKLIWKAKIYFKIHIFMWQTFRNTTPTRDTFLDVSGLGPLCVLFCKQIEFFKQLFFSCFVARVV
jgi:hypothetical protein